MVACWEAIISRSVAISCCWRAMMRSMVGVEDGWHALRLVIMYWSEAENPMIDFYSGFSMAYHDIIEREKVHYGLPAREDHISQLFEGRTHDQGGIWECALVSAFFAITVVCCTRNDIHTNNGIVVAIHHAGQVLSVEDATLPSPREALWTTSPRCRPR